MGDTFHQAAVAHEGVGVVVDDVVTRLVELLGHGLLGDRHADGIGDALTQRTGSGFNARRVTVLRVTRVRECSWRKFSDRRWRGHNRRCSREYSSMEPWPLERMKRSRSAHLGLFGLCLRWLRHNTSAISAIPMGRPGDRSWLFERHPYSMREWHWQALYEKASVSPAIASFDGQD